MLFVFFYPVQRCLSLETEIGGGENQEKGGGIFKERKATECKAGRGQERGYT